MATCIMAGSDILSDCHFTRVLCDEATQASEVRGCAVFRHIDLLRTLDPAGVSKLLGLHWIRLSRLFYPLKASLRTNNRIQPDTWNRVSVLAGDQHETHRPWEWPDGWFGRRFVMPQLPRTCFLKFACVKRGWIAERVSWIVFWWTRAAGGAGPHHACLQIIGAYWRPQAAAPNAAFGYGDEAGSGRIAIWTTHNRSEPRQQAKPEVLVLLHCWLFAFSEDIRNLVCTQSLATSERSYFCWFQAPSVPPKIWSNAWAGRTGTFICIRPFPHLRTWIFWIQLKSQRFLLSTHLVAVAWYNLVLACWFSKRNPPQLQFEWCLVVMYTWLLVSRNSRA